MAEQSTTLGRPVIVCTERRYVAFGYAQDTSGDRITLRNARCAVRWGTTGGIHELALTGPTSRSRIGARAPAVEFRGITAVFDVSPAAAAAWEAAP